jgi:hypothetical protein
MRRPQLVPKVGCVSVGERIGGSQVSTIYTTLKWPVISLLITGGLHFTAEAAAPDLKTVFVPAVIAPILLVYGLWVGYRAIGLGGNYGHAIAAAAILGLLPVMLDVVGFGLILGRGMDAGVRSGIFGFLIIMWGSLAASGFVLSGAAATRRVRSVAADQLARTAV